jgi:hypothetical protein
VAHVSRRRVAVRSGRALRSRTIRRGCHDAAMCRGFQTGTTARRRPPTCGHRAPLRRGAMKSHTRNTLAAPPLPARVLPRQGPGRPASGCLVPRFAAWFRVSRLPGLPGAPAVPGAPSARTWDLTHGPDVGHRTGTQQGAGHVDGWTPCTRMGTSLVSTMRPLRLATQGAGADPPITAPSPRRVDRERAEGRVPVLRANPVGTGDRPSFGPGAAGGYRPRPRISRFPSAPAMHPPACPRTPEVAAAARPGPHRRPAPGRRRPASLPATQSRWGSCGCAPVRPWAT